MDSASRFVEVKVGAVVQDPEGLHRHQIWEMKEVADQYPDLRIRLMKSISGEDADLKAPDHVWTLADIQGTHYVITAIGADNERVSRACEETKTALERVRDKAKVA